MVHTQINGYKMNALVDSGASRSVLDLSRARACIQNLSVGVYNKQFVGMGSEKIHTYIATIPGLVMGNMVESSLEILLLDLSPINTFYAIHDLPKVDMVLGGDFLMRWGVVIDYPNKRMMVCQDSQSRK